MWSDYKVKTGNSSYLPIFWLTAKPVLSTCAGNNLYVRLRLGCIDFHHTVLCCGSFFVWKVISWACVECRGIIFRKLFSCSPTKTKHLVKHLGARWVFSAGIPVPEMIKTHRLLVICRQDRQKSCVSLKEELLCSGDCQIKVTQWQNAMQHLGQ